MDSSKQRNPLIVVFLTVFVDLVGFGIVIPLLPLYAAKYSPPPIVFGLFMASFSLMQFLFAPLIGRLSDRYGRKPVLVLSLAGSFGSYLLFAFATSLPVLLLSRVLAGICGANMAAAQAVVADVTTPANRARGMGLVGAAFGLGFVFGPAIGGILVGHGERWPGLAAAGFSGLALVLAAWLLPETRKPGSDGGSAHRLGFGAAIRSFGHPKFGVIFLATFLGILAFSSFETTFAQYLSWKFSFTPQRVSWCFALVGVTMVLVQGGLVGRLSKKFSESKLAPIGLFLTSAGLLALSVIGAWPLLVPVLVLLSLGTGLTNPALSSLVSRSADPDEQGSILGIFQSMASLGRIAGPLAGQYLWGSFPHAVTHWFGGGLLAATAALLLARRASLAPPAEAEP
jgi:multidrug resistance protein